MTRVLKAAFATTVFLIAAGCTKSGSGGQGFEKPVELKPLPTSKTIES